MKTAKEAGPHDESQPHPNMNDEGKSVAGPPFIATSVLAGTLALPPAPSQLTFFQPVLSRPKLPIVWFEHMLEHVELSTQRVRCVRCGTGFSFNGAEIPPLPLRVWAPVDNKSPGQVLQALPKSRFITRCGAFTTN